ncbi:MAG: FKBP-type peptidyl-prolyl cis-trans isomerase SlyD [Candidatus Anoxychlamydiales bacterium]|nr:FKBP-type peptidyl-prolyl cis-trans isomerase SlyD [Candidatus Anoxychlamydiales bacterium]
MSEAKMGDLVKVHYTAKAENMMIFDSKQQVTPLEFKIGDGQIIPAFESALIGMKAGDNKTINIQSDEAFGPYVDELITKVDKNQLPPNLDLTVGQQLQIQQPDGQVLLVKVLNIADNDITFDANHPLAGKDIIFDINLVEIL